MEHTKMSKLQDAHKDYEPLDIDYGAMLDKPAEFKKIKKDKEDDSGTDTQVTQKFKRLNPKASDSDFDECSMGQSDSKNCETFKYKDDK